MIANIQISYNLTNRLRLFCLYNLIIKFFGCFAIQGNSFTVCIFNSRSVIFHAIEHDCTIFGNGSLFSCQFLHLLDLKYQRCTYVLPDILVFSKDEAKLLLYGSWFTIGCVCFCGLGPVCAFGDIFLDGCIRKIHTSISYILNIGNLATVSGCIERCNADIQNFGSLFPGDEFFHFFAPFICIVPDNRLFKRCSKPHEYAGRRSASAWYLTSNGTPIIIFIRGI